MSDDLPSLASQTIDAAVREEYLTVKEFAARFRMSEKGVRDAIRDGHLNPAYRVERPSKRTVRIAVPKRAA